MCTAQLVTEKRSAADGAFPLLDEVRKQANDPNRVAAFIDGHPAGAASASRPVIRKQALPLVMHATPAIVFQVFALASSTWG